MTDSLDELLGHARKVAPVTGAKGRMRRRVLGAAAAGAMSSAAQAAAAGAAKGATGMLLAYVGGGVALGLLVAGPALLRTETQSVPPPPHVVSAPRAPVPIAVNPQPSVPAVPTASAAASAPVPAPSVRPTLPSIERETALLAEAQRAIQAGNVGAAIGWLNRYDREFPSGNLVEEATAARAVCSCSSSPSERARTLSTFRSRFPGSPLLQRVSRACVSANASHDDFELERGAPATQLGGGRQGFGKDGELK